MIKLVFLVIILFANHIFSNEWKKIQVEDIGIAKKIVCIDTNICYLMSSSRLFKTTDKGESWIELLNLSSGFGQDIACPDSLNIYIGIDNGKIIYSNESGANFKEFFIDGITHIKTLRMFNNNIGTITGYYFTNDFWDTYKVFPFNLNTNEYIRFIDPIFVNDSILISPCQNYYKVNENSTPEFLKLVFTKLNINDFSFELIDFNHRLTINDFDILNDTLFIISGKSKNIQGGSGHDAVFKSTDAGYTWKKILDIYSSPSKIPNQSQFGIQKIAFKNDSTGIAVGQFGKIVYTYDGGESWIYETKLPPHLGGGESHPPTMVIEYAGDTPIIGDFGGNIHIMTEDTYAPKPEDTLTISGRVTLEGVGLEGVGLEGVAVTLNTNRITMTDENGYYKFRKLPNGNHIVKAINKYYDDNNPTYYYKPFSFSSDYNINLTSDTSNIDFQATDNRNFYSLSGSVSSNGVGLENIVMQFGSKTVTTNEDGYFLFEKVEQWRHNLTPITKGYTYEPEFYDITLNQNISSMDFTASPISSIIDNPNFQISNNILISKDITGLEYKIITLNGNIIESGNLSQELNLNQPINGTYILNITKGDKVVYTYKYQVVR